MIELFYYLVYELQFLSLLGAVLLRFLPFFISSIEKLLKILTVAFNEFGFWCADEGNGGKLTVFKGLTAIGNLDFLPLTHAFYSFTPEQRLLIGVGIPVAVATGCYGAYYIKKKYFTVEEDVSSNVSWDKIEEKLKNLVTDNRQNDFIINNDIMDTSKFKKLSQFTKVMTDNGGQITAEVFKQQKIDKTEFVKASSENLDVHSPTLQNMTRGQEFKFPNREEILNELGNTLLDHNLLKTMEQNCKLLKGASNYIKARAEITANQSTIENLNNNNSIVANDPRFTYSYSDIGRGTAKIAKDNTTEKLLENFRDKYEEVEQAGESISEGDHIGMLKAASKQIVNSSNEINEEGEKLLENINTAHLESGSTSSTVNNLNLESTSNLIVSELTNLQNEFLAVENQYKIIMTKLQNLPLIHEEIAKLGVKDPNNDLFFDKVQEYNLVVNDLGNKLLRLQNQISLKENNYVIKHWDDILQKAEDLTKAITSDPDAYYEPEEIIRYIDQTVSLIDNIKLPDSVDNLRLIINDSENGFIAFFTRVGRLLEWKATNNIKNEFTTTHYLSLAQNHVDSPTHVIAALGGSYGLSLNDNLIESCLVVLHSSFLY